jgi:3-oxoacyl-[acyl-carrier-protein] synthase-1
MRQALKTVDRPVGYINAHGTSTPVGDVRELEAVRETFGNASDEEGPWISSTKSLTGHSLGAAGVQEAIYSILMMKHGFVSASANIETLDPAAEGYRIARERVDDIALDSVMSNSFGFGGTNATLVFGRYDG